MAKRSMKVSNVKRSSILTDRHISFEAEVQPNWFVDVEITINCWDRGDHRPVEAWLNKQLGLPVTKKRSRKGGRK